MWHSYPARVPRTRNCYDRLCKCAAVVWKAVADVFDDPVALVNIPGPSAGGIKHRNPAPAPWSGHGNIEAWRATVRVADARANEPDDTRRHGGHGTEDNDGAHGGSPTGCMQQTMRSTTSLIPLPRKVPVRRHGYTFVGTQTVYNCTFV
jgi:hypothetical protein